MQNLGPCRCGRLFCAQVHVQGCNSACLHALCCACRQPQPWPLHLPRVHRSLTQQPPSAPCCLMCWPLHQPRRFVAISAVDEQRPESCCLLHVHPLQQAATTHRLGKQVLALKVLTRCCLPWSLSATAPMCAGRHAACRSASPGSSGQPPRDCSQRPQGQPTASLSASKARAVTGVWWPGPSPSSLPGACTRPWAKPEPAGCHPGPWCGGWDGTCTAAGDHPLSAPFHRSPPWACYGGCSCAGSFGGHCSPASCCRAGGPCGGTCSPAGAVSARACPTRGGATR